MPNNELQELLSKRFERHVHATNAGVWDAIEQQLDQDKSDRGLIWFWLSNGIASCIILGAIVSSSFNSNLTKISFSAPSKNQVNFDQKQENKASNNGKQNETIDHTHNTQLSQQKTSIGSLNLEFDKLSKPSIEAAEDRDTYAREYTQNLSTKMSSLTARMETTAPTLIHITGSNEPSSPLLAMNGYRSKNIPIQIGIASTYIRSLRSEQETTTPPVTSNSSNQNPEIPHLVDRFEFSFISQFNLTNKLRLSLGIGYAEKGYSILSPSNSINTTTFTEKSILVPTNLQYTIWNKNRFSIAAGLATQIEFSSTLSDNPAQENIFTSLNDPNAFTADMSSVQSKKTYFSLEPNAVIAYSLSPRISTYSQLGYRRYFGTASSSSPLTYNSYYLTAHLGLLFRIN